MQNVTQEYCQNIAVFYYFETILLPILSAKIILQAEGVGQPCKAGNDR